MGVGPLSPAGAIIAPIWAEHDWNSQITKNPRQYVGKPSGKVYSIGWDEFGYRPDFLTKTPQAAWRAITDYHYPAAFEQSKADAIQNNQGLQLAITSDPLMTYGLGELPAPFTFPVGADQFQKGGPLQNPNISVFKQATLSSPDSRSQWLNPTTGGYCNPFTYPSCDMTLMRNTGGSSVQMWDGSTPIDTTDRWAEKVDVLTREYLNGDYDWLFKGIHNVNMADTRNHSTCDSTGLDMGQLLGIAAAVVAVVAANFFTADIPEVEIGTRVSASVALGGMAYYYIRYSASVFDAPEHAIFLDRAGLTFGVGIGATVGGFVGSLLGYQLMGNVVGGGVGYLTITPIVIGFLPTLTGISSYVISTITWMTSNFTKAISWIDCKITAMAYTAAQDPAWNHAWTSDDKTHTGNKPRRWDTPSIAVMIVEEAKTKGLITTPAQAEFMFRGLLTGPALMMAGSVTTPADRWDGASGKTIYEVAAGGVNPLGELAPYQWNFDGLTGNYSLDQYYGADGSYDTLTNQIGNQDYWACQSWDVIRNHPGSDYALFNSNIDKWMHALAAKATLPYLNQQELIPGWKSHVIEANPCDEVRELYRSANVSAIFPTLQALAANAVSVVQASKTPCDLSPYTAFVYSDVVAYWLAIKDQPTALQQLCQLLKSFATEIGFVTDTKISTMAYAWLNQSERTPGYQWIHDNYETQNCKAPPEQPPTQQGLLQMYINLPATQVGNPNQLRTWSDNLVDHHLGHIISIVAGLLSDKISLSYGDYVSNLSDPDKRILLQFMTSQFANNAPMQKAWWNAWSGFETDQELVADLVRFSDTISPLPPSLLYTPGHRTQCTDFPNQQGQVTCNSPNSPVGCSSACTHNPDGSVHCPWVVNAGYYVDPSEQLRHFINWSGKDQALPFDAQAAPCVIFAGGPDVLD